MDRRHFLRHLGASGAAWTIFDSSTVYATAPEPTPELPASTIPASVIDVTDPAYGATGDGRNDDTVAINKAIAAGEARGGAVIWFPAGTYLVSPSSRGPLHIASRVTYGGVGYASCIRVAADAGDYQAVFAPEEFSSRVEHVIWRDLRIDQNVAEQQAPVSPIDDRGDRAQYAIFAADCMDMTVRNCCFDTCGGVNTINFNGFAMDGPVTDLTVEGCHFRWERLPNAANPDASQPAYDNSAVYLVGRRARVVNNTFLGDPASGPRCCCEFHGPAMTYAGNHAEGYQRHINVGPLSVADGSPVAGWQVVGNSGVDMALPVSVLADPVAPTVQVTVAHNQFHIDTARHGLLLGNGIRFSGQASADAGFGQFDISHNLILFEPDDRSTTWRNEALGAGQDFSGIHVSAVVNVLTTGRIAHNTIVNAPAYGLSLGSQSEDSATRNILVESNTIIDPGRMKSWLGGSVAFMHLAGRLEDIIIRRNVFIDEGEGEPIGGQLLWANESSGLRDGSRVWWEDNEVRTPNGATIESTGADWTRVHRPFASAMIEPGTIGPGEESFHAVTMPGARLGDVVAFSPGGLEPGLSAVGYVSSDDTVIISVRNPGPVPVDAAGRVWSIHIQRAMTR